MGTSPPVSDSTSWRQWEINTPSLIICGDQDALTPIKYSRYLAERISGSRLEVIEGAGHMVMLERPKQFNKKVEGFVRSVGAADA